MTLTKCHSTFTWNMQGHTGTNGKVELFSIMTKNLQTMTSYKKTSYQTLQLDIWKKPHIPSCMIWLSLIVFSIMVDGLIWKTFEVAHMKKHVTCWIKIGRHSGTIEFSVRYNLSSYSLGVLELVPGSYPGWIYLTSWTGYWKWLDVQLF